MTMIKILVAIFLILFTYCGLSIATIIKNGVSLTDEPGILTRLKVFLSTHKAETSDKALFNELTTPTYNASIDDVITATKQIAEKNAWSVAHEKSASSIENKLHFVATTQLINFKDDVSISLKSVNENQVTVQITSESRVGTADFGANLGRITRFINELDKQLKRSH